MPSAFYGAIAASTMLSGGIVIPPADGVFYDENTTLPIKAAWGLRKLMDAYSGNLIRVRDTTTNTEYDLTYNSLGQLDTSPLPSGTFACTTIYDQSGNSNNLVQDTAGKQAILTLNVTHKGGPALAFDGVDDFMRGATQATNLAYMIDKPVVLYLGGQRTTREQWSNLWAIPQIAGAHTNPFSRLGMYIEQATGTLGDTGRTRVNGSEVSDLKLFGINNFRGWHGHMVAPSFGKFMQAGVDALNITSTTTVTYPNATSMYLNGNGVGEENNGANFVELVVLDGTTATQNQLQALLDLMTHEVLWGSNSFYKLTLLEMFNNGLTDGGFAEIELRDAIGGTDRTYPGMPVMANRQFNSAEGWAKSIDNDNNSLWQSGGGTGSPLIHFLINANVEVQEIALRARNDGYSAYTGKKWQLARFAGPLGWQPTAIIDMTSAGISPGQLYVYPIDFMTDISTVSKVSKYAVFHALAPTVNKISKYTVLAAAQPSVSKVSKYTIFKEL